MLLALGIDPETAQTAVRITLSPTHQLPLDEVARSLVASSVAGGTIPVMSSRATVTVIVPGHDVAPYAEESAGFAPGADTDGLGRDPHRRRLDGHDGRDLRASGGIRSALPGGLPPRRTGLGAARNLGLGRVETPFIAFLDADDILAPQARRS